ncbi:MAG: DNA-binding response regulator [Verrucomicrobia bacterium]|nr:MAG: DNA-binding response regulator [Verrucomicrobiota bacterium]
MNDPLQRVFLVDDDPGVIKGLTRLLRAAGYDAVSFNSAQEFISRYNPDTPGCLILDISMPGITGLELQDWLMQTDSPLPVIFLTGHGDIPASVQAMKRGAVDFLTKPVDETDLFEAILEASRRYRQQIAARDQLKTIKARLAMLTPRERQVLEHVVDGKLNKQIADVLGTVEKTIKVHRARVMRKMGVQSLAELVRLAERAGIGAAPPPGTASLQPPNPAGRWPE